MQSCEYPGFVASGIIGMMSAIVHFVELEFRTLWMISLHIQFNFYIYFELICYWANSHNVLLKGHLTRYYI